MPSISAAFGGPSQFTAEEIPKFLEYISELDAPRSDRVRQRALDVVKDPETAAVSMLRLSIYSLLTWCSTCRLGTLVGASVQPFMTSTYLHSISLQFTSLIPMVMAYLSLQTMALLQMARSIL